VGVGMTPCVRKCRFALDRTPKDRVQPGNSHGKAMGESNILQCFETIQLTFFIAMRVHMGFQPARPINKRNEL
jgi:hypothetical protein